MRSCLRDISKDLGFAPSKDSDQYDGYLLSLIKVCFAILLELRALAFINANSHFWALHPASAQSDLWADVGCKAQIIGFVMQQLKYVLV